MFWKLINFKNLVYNVFHLQIEKYINSPLLDQIMNLHTAQTVPKVFQTCVIVLWRCEIHQVYGHSPHTQLVAVSLQGTPKNIINNFRLVPMLVSQHQSLGELMWPVTFCKCNHRWWVIAGNLITNILKQPTGCLLHQEGCTLWQKWEDAVPLQIDCLKIQI